jgi:hypothetical protein
MPWATAVQEQHQHHWIDARDHASSPVPLYLKDPRNNYWFEYLKDPRALYVQYNAVQDKDKPEETVSDFFKRVFQFADANPVDKFVLDIRLNGGGNGYLNWPLIYDIIRSDKVNQKGKLFTIIGRKTFSAGTCALSTLSATPIRFSWASQPAEVPTATASTHKSSCRTAG